MDAARRSDATPEAHSPAPVLAPVTVAGPPLFTPRRRALTSSSGSTLRQCSSITAIALSVLCALCALSVVSGAAPAAPSSLSPALLSLLSSAGVLFNYSQPHPYHQAKWMAPPSGAAGTGILSFDEQTQEMDLSQRTHAQQPRTASRRGRCFCSLTCVLLFR